MTLHMMTEILSNHLGTEIATKFIHGIYGGSRKPLSSEELDSWLESEPEPIESLNPNFLEAMEILN